MGARSRAQDSITLYLTQMGYDPDTTYLRYEGEGTVIVETPEGSKKLTVNLYEDIMEVSPDGSKKIIAESDLPHGDFTKLGTLRATSWTLKEGDTV